MKRKLSGLWVAGCLGLAIVAQAKDKVDTPVIDPAGGAYYGIASVTVTVTCATADADIRYTLDNTGVTEASPLYTEPLVLTMSATLKVKAFKTGFTDSMPAEAIFQLLPARVDPPAINPAGGSYTGVVELTITGADGATYFYTTNGVTPTSADTAYTAPFPLTASTTIKAIAVKPGFSDSVEVEAVFSIVVITDLEKDVSQTGLSAAEDEKLFFRFAVPTNVATLQFTLTGGTGDGDLLVKFGSPADTGNYDFYPALEGNEETVTVDNPGDGFWYATLLGSTGGVAGVQLTATYKLVPPTVSTPLITPAGGTKIGPILVTIACATTGATVRVTLDGSDPTTNSTVYVAPFKLTPGSIKTVKARAFNDGMTDSAVASVVYKIARIIKPGQTIVLSGPKGSKRYFAIKPSVGAAQLSISLAGGTGNANLYVRKSWLPTVLAYQFRSIAADNNELIRIPNPTAGKWYFILVNGRAAYANASLRVTIP